MRNKCLVLVFLCCFAGLVFAEGQKKNQVELVIKPGERWLSRIWILFIPVSQGLQIAAWIEDQDGAPVHYIGKRTECETELEKRAPKADVPRRFRYGGINSLGWKRLMG
jgi:hypothetical protein